MKKKAALPRCDNASQGQPPIKTIRSTERATAIGRPKNAAHQSARATPHQTTERQTRRNLVVVVFFFFLFFVFFMFGSPNRLIDNGGRPSSRWRLSFYSHRFNQSPCETNSISASHLGCGFFFFRFSFFFFFFGGGEFVGVCCCVSPLKNGPRPIDEWRRLTALPIGFVCSLIEFIWTRL